MDLIHEYLSKIGRRGGKIGGKAKSKAKVQAARENVKKAVAARRKYPPCTKYANRLPTNKVALCQLEAPTCDQQTEQLTSSGLSESTDLAGLVKTTC